MKNIFIFVTIMFTALLGKAQKNLPRFLTKTEKKFVRNVIKVQGTQPLKIIKRHDGMIALRFEDTIVILKSDGFIGEMWVRNGNHWHSLGTEEEN